MKDLQNKVVMVHPTLTHDPVNMQGHMGTISHINLEKDELLVRFKNQMLGLYSSDALLMLIPGMEILDKLRAHVEELESDELLDILGIYLLDATGELKWQKEALDMAMSKASLSFATVVSVEDYIDIHRDNGQEYSPGRSK